MTSSAGHVSKWKGGESFDCFVCDHVICSHLGAKASTPAHHHSWNFWAATSNDIDLGSTSFHRQRDRIYFVFILTFIAVELRVLVQQPLHTTFPAAVHRQWYVFIPVGSPAASSCSPSWFRVPFARRRSSLFVIPFSLNMELGNFQLILHW